MDVLKLKEHYKKKDIDINISSIEKKNIEYFLDNCKNSNRILLSRQEYPVYNL